MPTSVLVDDDEQIIADLQRDVRRLRSRLATTSPRGSHDEFTAAATPSTTYTLTYIPLSGTCLMALNGHVQREGTDYSVNYDTGIVTVSATQASGDKITFRYLVTDWLVARSLPPELDFGVTYRAKATRLLTASAVTSATLTLDAATGTGDGIAVGVYLDTGITATVSGLGATWTQQQVLVGIGDNNEDFQLWTGVGATSGNTTITITPASSTHVDAAAVAFAGVTSVLTTGAARSLLTIGSDYFQPPHLTATGTGQGVAEFMFVNGAPAFTTFADTGSTFTTLANVNTPIPWYVNTEAVFYAITTAAGPTYRAVQNSAISNRRSDSLVAIFT